MDISSLRRNVTAILVFPLVVCLFLSVETWAAATIEVTGEGQVKTVADSIILHLRVGVEDLELNKALSENNRRVKHIFEVLKKSGVAAKEIQTGYVHCSPIYSDRIRGEAPKFIGYGVVKKVTATVSDVSEFDSILTAVLAAGANYVDGINFVTSEFAKHKDTARHMAMKRAKEKAEAMAAAIGQKIGLALSIREAQTWSRSSYDDGGSSTGVMVNGVVSRIERSAVLGESFAPGELAVSAKVKVVFDLK